MTETQLRGLLGMFGMSGDKVFQESGTLSGGEKTKLALAMLMIGRNNLLLLDEPTNNLDPPSRQAVADALVDWPGAIIFVSHDTEFVHAVGTDQGAADARRRRRLLQRRLARSRLDGVSPPDADHRPGRCRAVPRCSRRARAGSDARRVRDHPGLSVRRRRGADLVGGRRLATQFVAPPRLARLAAVGFVCRARRRRRIRGHSVRRAFRLRRDTRRVRRGR